MIKGTTPTHTFSLPFDVSLIASAKVVYAQAGAVVLTKNTTDLTLEGEQLRLKLTQEETLKFTSRRRVHIQVKVLTLGGDALVSDTMLVPVEKCLDDEVLV